MTRRLLPFVTLLLFVHGPLCVYGVETGETVDNPFAMSLDQLMQVEITGATLTEKSLRTVPAAVTVFSREEISRLGYDYLHELLNLVPGYQSQRDPDVSTGSNYSSRGRRLGATSREVLLLLDGRPMNDPRTGGQALGTRIPLGMIDRVEVMRGPGSAIYGSNAFTGVINIITVDHANEATIRTGTDNRQEAELHLSGRTGDWHSRLYARGAYEGGQTFTVQDTFSPYQISTDDPAHGGDIDMTIGHDKTRLSLLHRQSKADDFYAFEYLANGFNTTENRDTLLTLEQSWNWHEATATHLLLGYRDTRFMLDTQVTPAGALALISNPPSSAPLQTKNSIKSAAQYAKLTNDWTLDAGSSIQYGVEWRREAETEARAYTNFDLAEARLLHGTSLSPVSYYGNFNHFIQIGAEEDRDVLGLYAQYQRPLWQQAELTMGVRYDNYSDSDDAAVSPRLAVVQQITAIHGLKLLYGEAFRAPTLSETGSMVAITGNPNLKDETIQTWDLIWMAQWRTLSLNCGWFYNRIKDPITQRIVRGTRTFTNMDEEENSQGLEMEGSLQITPQWLLRATFTHLTELPDTAFREAETLGSLMINYEKGAWNFNLAGIYHSERDMLSGNTLLALDDYWLLTGKIRYRYNKKWQLFVQAKNLLDEEYKTATQGNRLVEGIANRGRELSIGVTWQF